MHQSPAADLTTAGTSADLDCYTGSGTPAGRGQAINAPPVDNPARLLSLIPNQEVPMETPLAETHGNHDTMTWIDLDSPDMTQGNVHPFDVAPAASLTPSSPLPCLYIMVLLSLDSADSPDPRTDTLLR